MNILETIAVRIPCERCGGTYDVPLSDVLLSHRMLHEGCPVREETECPPLTQSRLFQQAALEAFANAWALIEQQARAAGGTLVLMRGQETKAA